MAATRKLLVIGALGQIGSELCAALSERHGAASVVAADLKHEIPAFLQNKVVFEECDVLDRARIAALVRDHGVDTIVNMAAILSDSAETHPGRAWDVNMNGLRNVLEVARELELRQVVCPSSIAVYGPDAPKTATPQDAALNPATLYGITKVAGELLCDYYAGRHKVDARGLRYPGIVSHRTRPGGGTTDYAVEIFYAAVKKQPYECFVREDTTLPMMYMPDCVRATLALMDAPFEALRYHGGYNVTAMSFSAGELAAEIQKHVPGFECSFVPDRRQVFAETWPRSIDDRAAREDWGWRPEYDLAAMTADMLETLRRRQEVGAL